MKPIRPVAHIRRDLETAAAYRERYQARPSDDPLVLMMREANEQEIRLLESELKQATAGEFELTLLGPAYDDHRVGIPLLTRILGNLQSTFRAVYRARTAGAVLHREEATLSLVATAPGSFKVAVSTPPTQLELLDAPLVDQSLDEIVKLFAAAEEGQAGAVAPTWAATQDQPVVRSMIKLSAALAVAQGSTTIRWHGVSTPEQIVTLRKEDARDLALALSGQPGREIITVTGHLEMGQDQPPKIRLRTPDIEYLARVPSSELLDRVKQLLFGEVEATLVIDMKTSPTTGSPDTDIELLDLSEA